MRGRDVSGRAGESLAGPSAPEDGPGSRFRGSSVPQLRIRPTGEPVYMLTIVDRGADILAASGTIGADLCTAFELEARRRVEDGRFFGFIAYASLTALKL